MWIVWTALDTPLSTTPPWMDTGRSVINNCGKGYAPHLMRPALTDNCPTGRIKLLIGYLLRLCVFISLTCPVPSFTCSEVVEALLRNEALTNIADNKGCYPLHLAAWKGDEHIVKLLIHQGPSHPKLNEQVWRCLNSSCVCVCFVLCVSLLRFLFWFF